MTIPEVLPLRAASRALVRELGFLQGKDPATNLWHSHCHALIEIDARGELAQSELPLLLRLDKSTASRLVEGLVARGWVRARRSEADRRARMLSLSRSGRARVRVVHANANARVAAALALLPAEERATVVHGMELYARALDRSRRAAELQIRQVRPGDAVAVARLIRTVMPEFGASGPGFAIHDPEVDDMVRAYRGPRSRYFVVTRRKVIVGAGGFAPLVGGDPSTCELRKMYFLPEVRGLGVGHALLLRCIDGARRAGFETMYLETLTSMVRAQALYERVGFSRLQAPMGRTGHFGCNTFYALDLRVPTR